jgi:6-phosphogluconolactonase
MLTRRIVTTLLAGVAAAPWNARAADTHPGAVFYDAVGSDLTCWQADIGNATLTRQGSMTAPALIQYAWRHPTKLILRLQQLRSVRQA